MTNQRENYLSFMFIKKIWRGEWPLVKTYWYLGVLFAIPFYAYLYYLEINFDELTNTGVIAGLIFFIFYIFYVVWINVGIWRSATFYILKKKENGDGAFWGYTAKVLVALGLIRATVDLLKGFF